MVTSAALGRSAGDVLNMLDNNDATVRLASFPAGKRARLFTTSSMTRSRVGALSLTQGTRQFKHSQSTIPKA